MAKVQPSALITDIKGKVGGVVFRSGGTGLIAQAKPKTRVSRTAAQRAVTAITTGTASQFSKDLTPTQQQQWAEFAASYVFTDRLGLKYTLTAQQWFSKINTALHSAGYTPLSSPPSSYVTGGIDNPDVFVEFSPTFSMTMTITFEEVNPSTFIVSASNSFPAGRIGSQPKKVIIAKIPTTTAQPFDLTQNWQNQYGIAQTPFGYAISCYLIDSGTGAKSPSRSTKGYIQG
jgi:hypothetical protein